IAFDPKKVGYVVEHCLWPRKQVFAFDNHKLLAVEEAMPTSEVLHIDALSQVSPFHWIPSVVDRPVEFAIDNPAEGTQVILFFPHPVFEVRNGPGDRIAQEGDQLDVRQDRVHSLWRCSTREIGSRRLPGDLAWSDLREVRAIPVEAASVMIA